YFSTSIIASRLGPAKPRAITWKGGGRLRDCLAGPAAELLPHMLGHEPLPRDDIERLGDILANFRELGAAAARARGRRRVNNAPARQIGGKVAPRHLAPREALHLDLPRRGLGLILPPQPRPAPRAAILR